MIVHKTDTQIAAGGPAPIATPALQGQTAAVMKLDSGPMSFRDAVRRAATENGRAVPLATIDADDVSVTVIHLSKHELVEGAELTRPLWVSLPSELLALCRGKPDALLTVQRILGLPQYRDPSERGLYSLSQFRAPQSAMFRPCAGRGGLSDRVCSTELEGRAVLSAAESRVRDFALEQYWKSYHPPQGASGYPFTGMGWTYDWGPESRNQVGVSEFVVDEGTRISRVRRMTPAEFCGSPS
jgi:hypothetical protein